MKKILLLLAILLGNVAITTAQQDAVISIIGAGVGGWNPGDDVALETFDGVVYTIEDLEINGEVKFRQDNDWAVNWGGTGLTGVAVFNLQKNISVPAGVYNVTFNIQTLEYSILPPAGSPAVVSIYGSAFGKGSVILTSADGENYATTANIYDNGVLMISSLKDGVTTMWSGADFPSGTAAVGETGIAVTSGSYEFSINIVTGAYAFTQAQATFPSVGIIGTATPGLWDADTDMTTEDGINYMLAGAVLTDGELKFRQDNAWDIAWGGTAFPTGDPSDANIMVVAGTYDIMFNRFTGAYSFSEPGMSTADFSGASDFSVYPNPTSGTLNFTSAQNVSVYDLSGRLVAQASNATSVDVSGLVKGIYLVKTDNGVSKQFIVK